MSSLSVLILAAGKGTRMKSNLPKVLHKVGSVPMVERVGRTVQSLKPASVCVVVGYGGDLVRTALKKNFPKTQFATQKIQNGSGGAVKPALAWLKNQKGEVIVACGDAPLITE